MIGIKAEFHQQKYAGLVTCSLFESTTGACSIAFVKRGASTCLWGFHQTKHGYTMEIDYIYIGFLK